MKNTTTRKLALHKNTLRQLNSGHLQQAAGGQRPETADSVCGAGCETGKVCQSNACPY